MYMNIPNNSFALIKYPQIINIPSIIIYNISIWIYTYKDSVYLLLYINIYTYYIYIFLVSSIIILSCRMFKTNSNVKRPYTGLA